MIIDLTTISAQRGFIPVSNQPTTFFPFQTEDFLTSGWLIKNFASERHAGIQNRYFLQTILH